MLHIIRAGCTIKNPVARCVKNISSRLLINFNTELMPNETGFLLEDISRLFYNKS